MTLDEICSQTTNPTLLNALHACRADHPLNKTQKWPFNNAWFLALSQPFLKRLSCEAESWLQQQARKEAGR